MKSIITMQFMNSVCIYLVNKPLSAADISEDDAQGWKIVPKISEAKLRGQLRNFEIEIRNGKLKLVINLNKRKSPLKALCLNQAIFELKSFWLKFWIWQTLNINEWCNRFPRLLPLAWEASDVSFERGMIESLFSPHSVRSNSDPGITNLGALQTW